MFKSHVSVNSLSEEIAMRVTNLLFGALCLAASGIAADGASATIITFSGLTGADGDPFTTYIESGFTVSPTLGTWFQAQVLGNPAPSISSGLIFGSPFTDAITVTEGGQGFSFLGFDIAANYTNVNYTFIGTLFGLQAFSTTGSLPNDPNSFDTIISFVSNYVIDTLVITVNFPDEVLIGSANIDNIAVSAPVTTTEPIPEPMTLVLLATNLALVRLLRRRRCM
jgi:hypothetical protein